MPTTPQSTKRIDTHLEKIVEQHEQKIDSLNKQVQAHETLLIGIPDCPGLVLRVKTLETSIGKIEDAIIGINVYMKIIAFISGAVGLSVIAFLFAVLTHTVEIIH